VGFSIWDFGYEILDLTSIENIEEFGSGNAEIGKKMRKSEKSNGYGVG
jgi:hypothetical protein